MSRFRFLLLALTVSGSLQHAFGQTPYQMNKITPASPTASALGKFGDVPVSYYNGTPTVSIPLQTITTANHNLQIQMNYDASGTRVAQDASWVGLGWSLSAGGNISRTVRQQDDFIEHGYYRAAALPDPATETDANVKSYLNNVYDGYIDAEPDIYSYNFCGHSGRFVLGKKADGSPVFSDEKNNLKIEYLDDQGKWQITTDDGFKYIFQTSEVAQDYSKNTLTETVDINGVQGLNIDLNSNPITAWFLDSITSPTGETVSFSYVKGKSLSLVSKAENYFRLNSLIYAGDNCSPQADPISHYFIASRQALTEVYLQKITFVNGSLEFNTSPRTDIEFINSSDNLLPPSKLDNIILRDSKGNQLKKYLFSYTYFHSGSTTDDITSRLKLDAITEYGSDNTAKPPYVFSYINPNSLPNKYSKGIDHWGFYNATNNSTLLPANIIPFNQPMMGANREPDETNLYAINGVLNKVKYPTGGSTTFEYELNDFANLHGDLQYKFVNKYYRAISGPNKPPTDSDHVTFIIAPDPLNPTAKIAVTTSCSYSKVVNDAQGLDAGLGYSNMRQILGPGNTVNVGSCTANGGEQNPGQTFTNRLWDPGTYSLEVLSNQNWSFFTSASWSERVMVSQRIGGGIRVKRITDEDGAGHSTVKRYIYTDGTGKSSGMLLSYPKYDATYQAPMMTMFWYAAAQKTAYICQYSANYTQLSSSSLYPPGLLSRSGIIGYSKVTELLGENGEGGKTEYYFHNQEETQDDFPGMPVNQNPLNGKLEKTRYYTAQNSLLKEDLYQYNILESNGLKGVKLFVNSTFSGPANGWNGYNYYTKFYNSNSYWTVNSSKSEIIYNGLTPNTPITTNFTYANNIHRAPTQMTVNKSDGSQLITKYKRSSDFPDNDNSFASQMKNDNVLAPVIEQQTLLLKNSTTKLFAGTYTSYQKYNSKFYRPNTISQIATPTLLGDLTESSFSAAGQPLVHPAYKTVAYNDLYDLNSGNQLTRHIDGGPSETYLWGYNNQYPIAKVVNASYQDLVTVLGQNNVDLLAGANPGTDTQVRNILSSLRTDTRLKNASVTVYTYSPLIGITSVTDPKGKTEFYEYDTFQRLINIKDNDGNIIKHMDYHYRP